MFNFVIALLGAIFVWRMTSLPRWEDWGRFASVARVTCGLILSGVSFLFLLYVLTTYEGHPRHKDEPVLAPVQQPQAK